LADAMEFNFTKGKLINIIDNLISQTGCFITIGTISFDEWRKLNLRRSKVIGYFFPCDEQVGRSIMEWYKYFLVEGEFHRPNSAGILLTIESNT
jgi:hypothetical protein